MSADQAQGLRRWAEAQGAESAEQEAAASAAALSSDEDRETAIARALIEIAQEERALAAQEGAATQGGAMEALGRAAASATEGDRETAIAQALIEIALEERAAPAPTSTSTSTPRPGPGPTETATEARPKGSPTAPPPRPARVAPPAPGVAVVAQAPRRLRVLGLSGDELPRARGVLGAWAARGQRWVGRPEQWQLTPVAMAGVAHQPATGYWALWLTPGPEAFRRGYRQLMALSQQPGPRRLLLLMPGLRSRRGLPNNLARVADELGIELLVIVP